MINVTRETTVEKQQSVYKFINIKILYTLSDNAIKGTVVNPTLHLCMEGRLTSRFAVLPVNFLQNSHN